MYNIGLSCNYQRGALKRVTILATAKKIAHKAGIALQDPKTPKKLRPIIASDLAQAPDKPKHKKKK
jgi:hypothetical protein